MKKTKWKNCLLILAALYALAALTGCEGSSSDNQINLIIEEFSITNTSEWNAALNSIRNGSSGTSISNRKTYILNINGSFSVNGFTTETSIFGNTSYITVMLRGNGTITLNSDGFMFLTRSNQILVMDSSNLTLQGRNNNIRPLISLLGAGAGFELRAGTITGNHIIVDVNTPQENTAYPGSAVTINNGASFLMSGGSIAGNSTYSPFGGAVYISSTGYFAKTGGIIYGNTGDANENIAGIGNTISSPSGHAVYWSGGSNPSNNRFRNSTLDTTDNLSTSLDHPNWGS